MLKAFRDKLATWLSPEREQTLRSIEQDLVKKSDQFDMEVNQRVADYLARMDLFEPLLRKYNIVFSNEYERPEEKLDSTGQMRLFMWAYGLKDDPSFMYVTDFIRNTQGNATVRKSSTDHQWFFGRAMIASITLFIDEVSRLASRYEEILAKKEQGFDASLPVE